MHRFTISAGLVLAATHPAFAGPIEVPPPLPPVVIETCSLAFDCFYAGLEIGHSFSDAEQTEENNGTAGFGTYDIDEGLVWGVFAGYNFQNGSLVYGGEIRYLNLDIEDDVALYTIDGVIEARARLGFAVSDAIMVYGAVGYSSASADIGGTSFDMTGMNYGVGAEYNINERIFVGADYTARTLEGNTGGFDYDADVDTATLRVGFRF